MCEREREREREDLARDDPSAAALAKSLEVDALELVLLLVEVQHADPALLRGQGSGVYGSGFWGVRLRLGSNPCSSPAR